MTKEHGCYLLLVEDSLDQREAMHAALEIEGYHVIAVPGHALLCATAAWVGTAALLITFGTQQETAGRIWDEGCSGKWTVTAADVKPKVEESDFLVDRPDYRQEDFQRTQ